MLRRSFAVMLVALFIGFAGAAAQTEQTPAAQPRLTKYEKFMLSPDKVLVTKSYTVAELPVSYGSTVSVQVAWALGETEKVYAASIGNEMFDPEELQGMLDGIDKMAQAIEQFDKLKANGISYSSPPGLKLAYYLSKGSIGDARLNLYLKVGGYFRQGTSTAPLREARDLIAQAQAKIVELRAQPERAGR